MSPAIIHDDADVTRGKERPIDHQPGRRRSALSDDDAGRRSGWGAAERHPGCRASQPFTTAGERAWLRRLLLPKESQDGQYPTVCTL